MEKQDKAVMFTGDQDVDEFVEKVSLYVSLKEYTGVKKAQFLASKLSKGAFQVYRRMTEDDKKDFDKIVAELLKEYKRGSRDREAALQKLKEVTHGPGTSIFTHAFEIQELVKLAYPEFNDASCQALSKDFFIKSLHEDMEIALKSKYQNFKDIDVATLTKETDRLTLAGVKVFKRPTTIHAVSCGSAELNDVDAIVEKVLQILIQETR